MPSKLLSPKLKPSIEFDALGTHWFIEVKPGISLELEHSVHEVLEKIDRIWSRFRDNSLVATMSRERGDFALSREDRRLIEWYQLLYKATDGQVTPLIGQTLSDAGYDASYRLKAKETIAVTPSWDERILLTDKGITMKHPAMIDVGAAGKGFAVDAVAALFHDAIYIIDAGGDIRSRGSVQSIGLEHPLNRGELIGTVNITDESICGSASNRRTWGDWHHIINPRISRPVRDVVATWAIADTAMHADGIASALFFMAPEQLASLGDFGYIVMYDNGKVYHTNTKDIQLFT